MNINDPAPYNPLLRIRPNDPVQATAWEEACRIALWLKERHTDCRVLAFGSLVRPNAWSPRSDIDIAVSGVSGFSWDLAWEAHEQFPKFEVMVVSTDPAPFKLTPSARKIEQEFIGEIFATGIEIPSPIQTITCEPELILIAKRLEQVAWHMEKELEDIFKAGATDIPKNIKCHACMFHANRYRYRMERGLDRVIGFIDRLKPKYRERDERRRLYKTAAKNVPGLRPALITPEIATWHSKFVKKEYMLMDPEEENRTVLHHQKFLPEIHRKTITAFSEFREFLIDCHAKTTTC